jgi:hypothetical protein
MTKAPIRAGSILAAQRLNWALWLVGSRHFCSRTDEGQGNRNPPSPRTERYRRRSNGGGGMFSSSETDE